MLQGVAPPAEAFVGCCTCALPLSTNLSVPGESTLYFWLEHGYVYTRLDVLQVKNGLDIACSSSPHELVHLFTKHRRQGGVT